MKVMQTDPLKGLYRRHQCYAIPFSTAILRQLRGDVPARILNQFETQNWSGYVSETIDPSTFSDASDFRDAYLAVEFMSKFPSWELGIDRRQEALKKFDTAERSCLETSKRLKSLYGTASTTVSLVSVLYTAARKIERLLGPFSWNRAEQFFAFGPGASFGIKRTNGDAYYKFRHKPEVTKECAALGIAVLRRHPGWFNHLSAISGCQDPLDNLNVVVGNRITTVPKNAKIDRVIAIEPSLNMFLQKGIGGLIRSILKRVSIDLDRQEPNQEMARIGSIDGSLATIDLSSASDTISLELVRQLLPEDWCLAIEQTRSSQGVLPDGNLIRYHKVSSMGNGFTFELESLIFWAISKSVLELHGCKDHRLRVYGDDIIVPSELYGPVTNALIGCGFSVNPKKSFASGPFRESCGKHYFMGVDVTPFYIREDIDSPDRMILALNNLRRFAARVYPWGLDGRFQPVYDDFRRRLPPWFRKPRIPDGYGDGALIGDFDEVCPARAPFGLEGWRYVTTGEQPSTFVPSDYPILLRALHGLEHRVGGGGVSETAVKKPSYKPRYRLIKSIAPQWENKGEWV